jgi:hypothetical protein
MPPTDYPIARWFLLLAATGFALAYALPLLLTPLAWARRVGWRIPADKDLTVYFGRCVGGVASAIVVTSFLAAAHPEQHVLLFRLIALVGAFMVAVHVWGAIERTQPWLETAEIPLYAALTVVAWAVTPV